MRLTLSLVATTILLFGASALTAESAEAKGFSPKRLRRAIKRRAPSRAVRYKRPRSLTSRAATRTVQRSPVARRAPTPFTAGRPILRPAPLDTRRKFYPRQFNTGSRGYLHRPRSGLPAFGAPTATGRAPSMAERFYYRNQRTANGVPLTGGRYASQARQARQATQARQARQYQQYRMPAWNQRGGKR